MTERREDIREQLRGGGITRSESAEAQKEIRGLDATLTELYQTLYGDQQGNILVTDENIKKIEELSETYIMANSEDKAIVNQLTSEYRDLATQYESAMKAGSEDADMLGTKMKGVKEDLVDTLQAIKSASAAQIAMPSFIKTEDLDINKIKEIEKLAREMEKRKLNFLVDNDIMDQATADQKVADAKPIFIDMGKEFGFYIAQGIMDSSSISDAIAASAEEGMTNLPYEFMKDVTESELMSIMPQYKTIRDAIVAEGGKSEEE
jgi:hypothetical protein